MMRHAFLLLTHQYSPILETLIKLLDNKHNDIYVHIDSKTKPSYRYKIETLTQQSRLYFTKRTRVYWGHISLVKAEYLLFDMAHKNGPYSYYHLLSGNDLTIKSQTEIEGFFSEHHDREFISFVDDVMEDRVFYRWLFPRHLRGLCSNQNYIYRKINQIQGILTRLFVLAQKKLHLKHRTFPIYKKGSEWVSLTDHAVEVLLSYQSIVLRKFRYSNCPDEYYKQTILFNESIRDPRIVFATINIYSPNKDPHDDASARLIDWTGGQLHYFTIDDWDRIIHSEAMFCRKIEDKTLAEKLYRRLVSEISQ